MDFVERLKNERDELEIKIEKLSEFRQTKKFKSLSQIQKSLLKSQEYTMLAYDVILCERLADLGEI